MQFPDFSWLFTTVSPDIAGEVAMGQYFLKGVWVFPEGSTFRVTQVPDMIQGFPNPITSNIAPSSTVYSSFSSGSTTITASGNTVYSLTGTNTYSDPLAAISTNVIGTQSPFISYFTANLTGNSPGSPLQISYGVKGGTSVALTSNMRSISIPSDAFSGALTVNSPQNGEIFTLTLYDSNTNQTQQVNLTVDNSDKIFNCLVPGEQAVPVGLRSIFNGSGELTIQISPDSQRLYFGRALSTPAIMYLQPNLIEFNGVSNLNLSGFNFYSDGTPCILAEDNSRVYVCQPSGGKVSIFDSLTQQVVSEIAGTRPTNIEINDSYIVTKDNGSLNIYDKGSLVLIQQHSLTGSLLEANDKEIFISSDRIFFLDGNKIKIIDLADLATITKTVDLGDSNKVISGCLLFSESLNRIFIIGLKQDDLTGTTHVTTGVTTSANMWVWNLTTDQLEFTTNIGSSTRGDIRFGARLDIDDSRVFVVSDLLNTVYAISTDSLQNFKVIQKWNTLKPFGITVDPTGKYMYYSGQDENSISTITQRSRHLVIMRLFDPQLTIEIV